MFPLIMCTLYVQCVQYIDICVYYAFIQYNLLSKYLEGCTKSSNLLEISVVVDYVYIHELGTE